MAAGSATPSGSGFAMPEVYNFPPFFTLQPNDETRAKQFEQWKDLIVGWHAAHGRALMSVADWPLFENRTIGRRLSAEGVREVMSFFVERGFGAWEDDSRARCHIFFRSPAEWAAKIYDHARRLRLFDSMFTIYEIANGDFAVGEEFRGLEASLVHRAVQVLEREGKALLVADGAVVDEIGVKFKEV